MSASSRCPCLRTDPRAAGFGEAGAEWREEGYALIAVLVAVFLVLLALSVAAPTVARALRRDREVEAVHRADQYVRAIQLYYRKFGHYPGSLDQLEKSNNIRFLRQRYPNPFTGKPDWRLIKVGTNKTTVKGFFGQPLAGVASTGLGTASGMSSGIGAGATASSTASTFGSNNSTTGAGMTSSSTDSAASAAASGSAASNTGSTTDSSAGTSSFGGTTSAFGASSPGTSTGIGGSTGAGSQSATSFSGGGAPFLGVGLPSPGDSILTVNEKTAYPDWEFLYDPRIEQLRSKVNLLGGGGVGGTGTSTLGSAQGMNSTSITPSTNATSPPTDSSGSSSTPTTGSSGASTPAGSSTTPQ